MIAGLPSDLPERMMNEPHTLSVFSFRVYDPHLRRAEIAPYKATTERIVELAGEALEGTEEQVLPQEVDLLGCHGRTHSQWMELE